MDKLYEKTTDGAHLQKMTELIIDNNALRVLVKHLDHDNENVSTTTITGYCSVFTPNRPIFRTILRTYAHPITILREIEFVYRTTTTLKLS